MDDVHPYFLGRELDQGIAESLDRAVHVSLDDDVEFLEVADGDPSSELFQGDVLLGSQALDSEQLLTLVGNLTGIPFVIEDIESVACLRSAVKTQY